MTNHVHLLLTPDTKDGISNLFQSLGRYYVRYINSTYCRTGTLWEGRFKASLVCSPELTLNQIRTAADKGWVLGNDKFKLQIEKQLGYKLPPFQRGGDRKSGRHRRS